MKSVNSTNDLIRDHLAQPFINPHWPGLNLFLPNTD